MSQHLGLDLLLYLSTVAGVHYYLTWLHSGPIYFFTKMCNCFFYEKHLFIKVVQNEGNNLKKFFEVLGHFHSPLWIATTGTANAIELLEKVEINDCLDGHWGNNF